MAEPLPIDITIATKLKALGIVAPGDPQMRVLGGKTVGAELEARGALDRLSNLLSETAKMDDLDDFDAGHLTDAAEAVVAYQRARRELLRYAPD